MELLLSQKQDEIKITGRILEAAAKNNESGREIIEPLLNQRGDGVEITGMVDEAVAGNTRSGRES